MRSMSEVETHVCQLLPESIKALTWTLLILTGKYLVNAWVALASSLCSWDFRMAGRSWRC